MSNKALTRFRDGGPRVDWLGSGLLAMCRACGQGRCHTKDDLVSKRLCSESEHYVFSQYSFFVLLFVQVKAQQFRARQMFDLIIYANFVCAKISMFMSSIHS